MNDKIKQVKEILDRFEREDYIDLEKMNEAKELLDKCVDPRKNVVIAFTREELNDKVKDQLARKFEVNDHQWEQVICDIHDADEAWYAMEDAVDRAVDRLVDSIKYELSCH